MRELVEVIAMLLKWWFGKSESDRQELVAAINKRQEGWKSESPTDIFGN